MTDHGSNKRLVAGFLAALADAPPGQATAVVARHCHAGAVWEVFHPFDTLPGDAVAEAFWEPLKRAFPDYEARLQVVVGNAYEGRDWVSAWGHLQGNFAAAWLGIPPTQNITFLNFGIMAMIVEGRIAKAYVLLDIIDVMRQAGFYPLRRMPGSPEVWPGPPASAGGPIGAHDGETGRNTLRIVREMQTGLAQGEQLKDLASARGRHSPHWHRNMNWYGPAGIGSSRGQRGFLDYHGALFIQAFPDRTGIVRAPDGPQDAPGHFIQAGDGRFAVTSGWPSLYGTHLGGQWLGLPPTGRRVEMRVADWYRVDEADKIIDNWVIIDVPHILAQLGLDVFDDLRYFADRSLPRWPQ